MNYVPLWIKTDYSILNSLIKIDDLIDKLVLLGIKACAICDDNLYGAMEFYTKCKQKNIKPIIGLEVCLDYTILLYAKNYKGYQNLCNINTLINEKKLNYDILINYLDNVLVIIPYDYKAEIEHFKLYCEDVFIGYCNLSQKNDIAGNMVYVKRTLALDYNETEYLTYLYKIKDEEYTFGKDVFLEEEINLEDKKNTIYLSNLCNLVIPKNNDLLPLYSTDKNFNAFKYLTDLCIVGLKKRLDGKLSEAYVSRLKMELGIINEMGFCNYFLVVWDYVKYAKKNDILVGPGRGSAASSLVSYCLGITDVDPLKYDLLFERFLNPQRVSMPDIDIDFDAKKRQKVIDYVVEKYGKDKVSGIITFSNLLAKQVIRDVARIFDVGTFRVDNLLKNFDDKKDLRSQLSNGQVKKILSDDSLLKKVFDISCHLEGLKRHTSSHAAGIIISSKNLSDYVPLALNTDNTYLCGYTMNYIESLGLLKMDFLALKNLSIIDGVLKKIGEFKLDEIPFDDKPTYDLFCSGNLDGVFQFESSGMKKFIVNLKPDKFDDLIAAIALFRPGPMENIQNYIARRHGKQKVTYINDDLKEILESTYGIIIYQEQIMQIASKMAGFSYAEADELRRAMSKKKEDILLSYKQKFIIGSVDKGYDVNAANEVYDLILKFANYGFNKAHSVSYAIIGYKMAYLKVHYPLFFMSEILNNSVGTSIKTKSFINECKKLGVDMLKPSVNLSSCNYEISREKLIFPLSIIKGVGALTCKQIVDERFNNGNYVSYLDFVKRNYKLGKDVIKNVILSGALECFNNTRKTMIENIDEAFNYADLCSNLDEQFVLEPELKQYDEYNKDELSKQEMEVFGFYINNHPTNKYIDEKSITTNVLSNYFDKNIKITLYLERKKEINTKNNEKMMFINASDIYGMVELVIFPKVYNKYFNIIVPGIYEVTGKVEKRFSKIGIVVFELNKK